MNPLTLLLIGSWFAAFGLCVVALWRSMPPGRAN